MYIHRIFLGTVVAMGVVVTALPASAAGLFGLHDHGTWFGSSGLGGLRIPQQGSWASSRKTRPLAATTGTGTTTAADRGRDVAHSIRWSIVTTGSAGTSTGSGDVTGTRSRDAMVTAGTTTGEEGAGNRVVGRAGRDALSQPVRGWWQRYRLLRSHLWAIPQSRYPTRSSGQSQAIRRALDAGGNSAATWDKPRESERQCERRGEDYQKRSGRLRQSVPGVPPDGAGGQPDRAGLPGSLPRPQRQLAPPVEPG